MSIEYRTCTTIAEYKQVIALEMLVWGMPAADAINSHTMQVIRHVGGHILGAFDGNTMIGCTLAFATREPERLWSHLAAVHPDYQSKGIGYELKQQQKLWAQAQGYQRMSWTFDPLQRRNAHFNFEVLGAECQIYHENFYGVMNDGLNAGIPSDRFELTWHFEANPCPSLPDTAPLVLEVGENQAPEILSFGDEKWLRVAIPYDIAALKIQSPEIALEWRYAMREVFQQLFAKGYKVLAFTQNRESKEAFYWLEG